VGVEDGVNLGEVFAEGLLAEVRACVDEDVEASFVGEVFKMKRAAGAIVAGVARGADGARTADDGDANGGSSTEKG